jgi:hypothetical protein
MPHCSESLGVSHRHIHFADRARDLMQSGHALAAAAEGVTLHHIALFLVMWVPGASVALDSEGLAALTPWRVLRVCLRCPQ